MITNQEIIESLLSVYGVEEVEIERENNPLIFIKIKAIFYGDIEEDINKKLFGKYSIIPVEFNVKLKLVFLTSRPIKGEKKL